MFEFSFLTADETSACAHVERIDGMILHFLNADLGTESVTHSGARVVVAAQTLDRLNQIIADLAEEGMIE